jgi:pyrroline-5-carboxylate reductase
VNGVGSIVTTVGFMGVGGIASALTKGFCDSGDFAGRVFLYNPHTEKSQALKERYPDKIVVTRSNQELIDSAEIVFPTMLPGVLREVAPSLVFRRENRVVHIAAGIKLGEIKECFAPARGVARCVPLPFASRRIGPVVLYGDDPEIEALLALLGSVVKVGTEKDLEILAAITGMMVSYYAVVGETIKWGMQKGIDFQRALEYTTFMNEALSTLMRSDCTEDIEKFLLENTTPRGMNELGLKIMRDSNAYKAWSEALEQIGRHYGLLP